MSALLSAAGRLSCEDISFVLADKDTLVNKYSDLRTYVPGTGANLFTSKFFNSKKNFYTYSAKGHDLGLN